MNESVELVVLAQMRVGDTIVGLVRLALDCEA
jgi:hypothetical protein